ncbi:MAG TPA: D-sedoheptulose 7-phosphate isomerase [bacterium]|nr:D-sedoheptulose 7-phosphate isomerase [bacterium]
MSMESLEQDAVAFLRSNAEAQSRIANESVDLLLSVADTLVACIQAGGKILIFGNGGSAADAQHFAGEIVGRFLRERGPLAAIALTADTSVLTAIGNDYGFEEIFSRQVQGLGKPGDVAFGISTSGNSSNVLKALQVARDGGMKTIALTGPLPNRAAETADQVLCVDSKQTPIIQQIHITFIHLLCLLVEKAIFGEE